MSRNAGGTYTLPAGNPVSAGELIESAWANSTMGDIATALTDSLSRTGLGGMLAPFQNASGTITAPGIVWTAEPTSGWYRKALNEFYYAIGGVDIFGITSAGIVLASGTAVGIDLPPVDIQDDELDPASAGDLWYESDTGAMYLRYQNPDLTFTWILVSGASPGDFIPMDDIGIPGGVAGPLDAFGDIPVAQIPDLSAFYLTPAQIGVPSGIAGLDSGGNVPQGQMGTGFLSVVVSSASGSHAVPANAMRAKVTVKGAGGGGGGSTSGASGGGGGEGLVAHKWASVVAGATVTITIGAGGAAVAANTSGGGGTGGNSTWTDGTTTVVGGGGIGGTQGNFGAAPGAGASFGSGGDWYEFGAPGTPGGDTSGAVVALHNTGGGRGGGVGAGGTGVANSGGGGAGGSIGSPSGAGADGQIITEYWT